MPTFGDVTVSLQSQYDALTIPERISLPSFTPPVNSNVSSLDRCFMQQHYPKLSNPAFSSIIDVSIPTYPSSQFWISYRCVPPPKLYTDEDVRFYYFKLFANGNCISSWGVGEQDGWSGKMMYALFHAGTDFEGKKVVEKRGLFFPKTLNEGSEFEIRVFRAKARNRETVKYESLDAIDVGLTGFDLTNVGRVKRGERQRMYTYALLDPKHEPYVTFKYTGQSGGQSTESIDEPLVAPPHSHLDPDTSSTDKDMKRRLSVPPRRRLAPTSTSAEPTSPIKKKATASSLDSSPVIDFFESRRRDWVTRTPSPMVSRLFDLPATPPSSSRRQKVKNVLANALKRDESEGSGSWKGFAY